MSIRTTDPRLIVAALLAAVGTASAQDQPEVGETLRPELPRYRVAVLLFAHAEVAPGGEEVRDEHRSGDVSPAPAFGRPLFTAPQSGDGGSASEPAAAEPAAGADPFEFIDPFGQLGPAGNNGAGRSGFRFRVLRSDELQLRDAFARIGRLGAYRALAHGGWIQDAYDEPSAQPMNLANLGVVNPVGTLRLSLSRFLHLSVDLEYQTSLLPAAAEPGTDFSALAELALQPRYRMIEQRRARSGELHYIDHPLFGLLFLITPAPAETPVDEPANRTPAA
jgi:hypothetical protein